MDKPMKRDAYLLRKAQGKCVYTASCDRSQSDTLYCHHHERIRKSRAILRYDPSSKRIRYMESKKLGLCVSCGRAAGRITRCDNCALTQRAYLARRKLSAH